MKEMDALYDQKRIGTIRSVRTYLPYISYHIISYHIISYHKGGVGK